MVDLKEFTQGYAASIETTDHIVIKNSYCHFIDGKFDKSVKKGTMIDTINPATEEKLAEVPLADSDDVNRAVESARKAYDSIW